MTRQELIVLRRVEALLDFVSVPTGNGINGEFIRSTKEQFRLILSIRDEQFPDT